ncbi:MAG: hypothetical protein JW866_06885, partial [Ignavibacteriales bacterium]|nr:hypothetical protein [Ignavibacteriales bacterium]
YKVYSQEVVNQIHSGISWVLTECNWEQEGASKIYECDELFDYINGGADVYYEYGFNKVLLAKYKNEKNSLYLDIYEMNDSSSAFGIFSLNSNCQGELLKGFNNARIFDYYILLWSGNYFISLTYENEIVHDTNFVVELIEEIEKTILRKYAEPSIIKLLPSENLICRKYLRGHLSFNDIYHFDNKNIFLFVEAVAGEYENDKVIIMKYFDVKDRSEKSDYSLYCIQNNPKFSNFKILDGKVTFNDKKNNYFCLVELNEFFVIIITKDNICFDGILKVINNKIQ